MLKALPRLQIEDCLMARACRAFPNFDLPGHLAHIDRAIAETRRHQAQRDAVPHHSIGIPAAMPWIAGGAMAGVVAAALNAAARLLF